MDSFDGIDTSRVLDVLVHNLEGMVFRCSIDATWTIHFVSSGCLALTGYKSEELKSNRDISFEKIMHPDDRYMVRNGIMAAIAEHRRYFVEYRDRKSGV